MFASLWHGAVSGRNHQNRAVHLRRARNHIFDVVGVSGSVHVRVVAFFRFVFGMVKSDGDPPRFFFGRFVNLVNAFFFFRQTFQKKNVRDGSR